MPCIWLSDGPGDVAKNCREPLVAGRMSELEVTWCDNDIETPMVKPWGIIDVGDVGTDLESKPGKEELENSVHCPEQG